MLPQEFIPITNDPNSNKKRGIRITRFIMDFSSQTMMVTTFLSFFEEDPNEADGYGKRIRMEYERTLTASNVRKVNPANGKMCTPDEQGVYHDVLGNEVQNPAGEYDFYLALAYSMPIVVMDFIKQLIIDEDLLLHTYDSFTIYDGL